MKLSKEEVEHIAKLARLKLSDDDTTMYSKQLSDILDYIEKMQSVNTENVEPTSQVTGLVNIEREDKIIESGILYKGSPAKPARDLTNKEIEYIKFSSKHYVNTMKQHVNKK